MSTADCVAYLQNLLQHLPHPYPGNQKFKRLSKKKNANKETVRLFQDNTHTFELTGDASPYTVALIFDMAQPLPAFASSLTIKPSSSTVGVAPPPALTTPTASSVSPPILQRPTSVNGIGQDWFFELRDNVEMCAWNGMMPKQYMDRNCPPLIVLTRKDGKQIPFTPTAAFSSVINGPYSNNMFEPVSARMKWDYIETFLLKEGFTQLQTRAPVTATNFPPSDPNLGKGWAFELFEDEHYFNEPFETLHTLPVDRSKTPCIWLQDINHPGEFVYDDFEGNEHFYDVFYLEGNNIFLPHDPDMDFDTAEQWLMANGFQPVRPHPSKKINHHSFHLMESTHRLHRACGLIHL